MSIKSNFVTFVVAYAPTEEEREGQKAKYMETLSCIVASVPAREYVFVSTDANARTGKRGEGGGEADSRCWAHMAETCSTQTATYCWVSQKTTKLALLNTLLSTLKSGVSYTIQSANRSKGQARLHETLTKQADHRLIRCVNVRRLPLEASESDRILVYAKVRIPRRSAPNRRKRASTKETPKLADLGRLMTDPNLRCQVANAMAHRHQSPMAFESVTSAPTLPTPRFSLCANWYRTLSARTEHRVGGRGPVWKLRMKAAWKQREGAGRHLRAEPHNSNLRKAVKMAGKKLRKVRKAAVLSFFWDFGRKLETRTPEGDQVDSYKHLKNMNLKGKQDRSSAHVKDVNGVLLTDVEFIRERWFRWFHTFLNPKSPRLDPNMAEGLDQ